MANQSIRKADIRRVWLPAGAAVVSAFFDALFLLGWPELSDPASRARWILAANLAFIGCAVWAFIGVFRELASERRKHEPDLRAIVHRLHIGQVTPDSHDCIAVLFMGIENHGEMPSITKEWRVSVWLAGGASVRSDIADLAGDLVIKAKAASNVKLSPDEVIFRRTESQPIQQGSQMTGHLPVAVYGVTPTMLLGSKVVVRCLDICGNEVVGKKDVGATIGEPPIYIPGLQVVRSATQIR